jgi:hypothetical protein
MNQEYKRAKAVEQIMLLAWDSLSTHLKYTHIKTTEGTKFHREAIRDYLKIMAEAYKLY